MRERLLELAEADADVEAAAVTGSLAVGAGDAWSDIDLAWHHVLHARACIEREKPWQAEYWISGIRDQVLALACRRLGHPTSYAKGADLLPPELTSPLEPALVRSLDDAELRRALAAATAAELDRTDPALAARPRPVLAELAAPRSTARPSAGRG